MSILVPESEWKVQPNSRRGKMSILGAPFQIKIWRKREWISQLMAICECSCGVISAVPVDNIFHPANLGCDRCDKRLQPKKHGDTAAEFNGMSRLYGIWAGMITRCTNENATGYESYGGRGIAVCDEWAGDYGKFKEWALASGYADNLTIDRKDNSDGYFPENCQWLTLAENSRKARNPVLVEAFGEKKTIYDWSQDARCVVCEGSLRRRLKIGLRPEIAMSSPKVVGNPKEKYANYL